jgi:uncharacterized protein (TIGR02757 family)
LSRRSLLPRAKRPDVARLAEHLNALRLEWDGRRLDSDPLFFAHQYPNPVDREIVAFLAASFAFGRVASIKASIEKILVALGPSPARFLDGYYGEALPLKRFKHRWVTLADLELFLLAVARVRREHGSLRNLFAACDHGEPDFVPALERFYSELAFFAASPERDATRGLRFLLPNPGQGSACKRAHLFLRWMIRDGDLDLGLWRGARFDPARLLLPMDTHVHRISTYLGLTRRKSADLAAAREATAWLRKIAPHDPAGFDWALSRLGILAECVRERTRRHCERCAVRPVCRVSLVPADAVAAPADADAAA